MPSTNKNYKLTLEIVVSEFSARGICIYVPQLLFGDGPRSTVHHKEGVLTSGGRAGVGRRMVVAGTHGYGEYAGEGSEFEGGGLACRGGGGVARGVGGGEGGA